MVVISICVTQGQVKAAKREEEAGRGGRGSLGPETERGQGPTVLARPCANQLT